MAIIGYDLEKISNKKFKTFLERKGISLLDLLQAAFRRLCEKYFKPRKVSYTYNPLPKNKREKLGEFITTYFKNKSEFAEEAGLDLSMIVAILNNRRSGSAITWKKINDAFEKHKIKLPYDLQIKYKVVDNFG